MTENETKYEKFQKWLTKVMQYVHLGFTNPGALIKVTINHPLFHSILLCLFFGLLMFYITNKLFWLSQFASGNVMFKIVATFFNFKLAWSTTFYPSFAKSDVINALYISVPFTIWLLLGLTKKKKYRIGEEFGSAKWATPAEFKPYEDKNEFRNIILTETERKTIDTRIKGAWWLARNNNLLVEGTSGTGKTRSVIEPNLMQASPGVSYVVTDPKASILPNVGKILKDNNFEIRVLDLIEMSQSSKYDPIKYIENVLDVTKLVTALMKNTTDPNAQKGDPFWEDAQELYLTALVSYVAFEDRPKNMPRNFVSVLDLLANTTVPDDSTPLLTTDVEYDVHDLFNKIKNKKTSFAYKQYRKYMVAANKTAQSIIISLHSRFVRFDIPEARALFEYDELELKSIGDRATAFFILTSDTDKTFNCIAAMVYTQMFNLLQTHADRDCPGKRLPYHVRFLLDEFANIHIPNFDQLISTIRSREMSATIVIQSQSQLKNKYKDSYETIIGNCDMHLFLGSQDPATTKSVSDALGKTTIDTIKDSKSYSEKDSTTVNFDKTGRELMTQSEVGLLDNRKCILRVRGLPPFLSKKYDISMHPRYKDHAECSNTPYVFTRPGPDASNELREIVGEPAPAQKIVGAFIGEYFEESSIDPCGYEVLDDTQVKLAQEGIVQDIHERKIHVKRAKARGITMHV